MLNIEDVKVGDELECIDKDYAFKNLGNKIDPKLIVSHVCDDVFSIGSCLFNYSDIKYFKKKEQTQYTFDDLIDVAVQAYKDGIATVKIDTKLHTVFVEESRTTYGIGHIDLGIKFIQSLYKETFVIECEDDIDRIKKGAKITLLNGNKSKVKRVDDDSTLEVEGWDYFLQFFSLKGATVEQSKC